MFHVDGGSGIELVSEPDNLKMLGAAVSPDGRYIWYARRTGDWTYNAQFPQYQIEAYDRESGERYTRSSRYARRFGPRSPPTAAGSYSGRVTRNTRDSSCATSRAATSAGSPIRCSATTRSRGPRWTYFRACHSHRILGTSWPPTAGKIWKLPVDGGEAEEIPFRVQFDLALGPRVDFDYPIEDTPTFTVRQIRDAAPSPSGDRLAFTALDRLRVSGADGSNPERLTGSDMSEHFATWSPDGEWIAYSTWDGNEGHLYKTRSDGGGDPVRLTRDAATYFAPAWGPGDRIVAVRGLIRAYETQGEGGAPGTEIVWVSADPDGSDGGPATLIAPTDGRANPHFTEGNDRIHLFRFPDALVSIRWDGTDEKEHVKVRGPRRRVRARACHPRSSRWRPVGDQALAEIQRRDLHGDVPRVGVTPTINVSNPDNASFPARRVTDMRGVPGLEWRRAHGALLARERALRYDLDAAQAYEDSVEAAEAEDDTDEETDEEAGAEAEEEEEEETEEDEEDEGYRAVEHRILIEAPRDIPSGVAVLRGGRAITMAGTR